jgi:hypothetical protein
MKYLLFLIVFFFMGCYADKSPILNAFNKLNPETKDFFTANTKLQCNCLKTNKSKLEKMLKDNESLLLGLKSKKMNLNDVNVQKQLENSIYPALAAYSNCNASALQPKPETLKIIEKDLQILSSTKFESIKADNIFMELSNQLLQKHCSENAGLRRNLDELSILISPLSNQK